VNSTFSRENAEFGWSGHHRWQHSVFFLDHNAKPRLKFIMKADEGSIKAFRNDLKCRESQEEAQVVLIAKEVSQDMFTISDCLRIISSAFVNPSFLLKILNRRYDFRDFSSCQDRVIPCFNSVILSNKPLKQFQSRFAKILHKCNERAVWWLQRYSALYFNQVRSTLHTWLQACWKITIKFW
jgi:uncharacterized membrane protein